MVASALISFVVVLLTSNHFYTCALGECLYTGLFGTLDHSDPPLISG